MISRFSLLHARRAATSAAASSGPAASVFSQSFPRSCARFFASYPDHTKLVMPKLSPTMETGLIKGWEAKEGDEIAEGDTLCSIQTDKASMDFDSDSDGFLAKILADDASGDVPLGAVIGILVESADDVAAFANYTADEAGGAAAAAAAPAPAAAAPAAAAAASPSPAAAAAAAAPAGAAAAPPAAAAAGHVAASPYARKQAASLGVDVARVAGTGPRGRIVAADVAAAAAAGSAPAGAAVPSAASASASVAAPKPAGGYTDRSNAPRRVIAQRLTECKSTVPHYYLSIDVNMDGVLKLREELNEGREKPDKISVNDFVIKAASKALHKVPECNSSWLQQEQVIREHHYVDISVAVQTELGLITPIVFDADFKGLDAIANDVKSLAAKARDGKLTPDEYQGGTFTISNLGMYGIKSFSAIINPPQSCILAVGAALPAPGLQGMKPSQVMNVTLSCDHRVVDGAVGAQWLQEFKKNIEKPIRMLL